MNKLTWIEIIEHIKISQFQPFILYYYTSFPYVMGIISVCGMMCVYSHSLCDSGYSQLAVVGDCICTTVML